MTTPLRPDHPDFWLISRTVLDLDAQSDAGRPVPEILGRMADPESANYAAIQRAMRAVRQFPQASPLLSVLAGLWLDGFTTGMHVQQAKMTEAEHDDPE